MSIRLKHVLALAVTAFLLAPSHALAWDFSCSPKTSTTVEIAPPPNIMLMLDRSGSMDWGDRVRSCKVCEEPDGSRYEVNSASECAPRGIPWQRTESSNYSRDNSLSGYVHTLVFDNLPAASNDLTLELDITGDAGGRCEWFDITIDGVFFESFNPRWGGSQCRTRDVEIVVPATFAADGIVTVEIAASPDDNSCNGQNTGCARNNRCDGVDASCNDNEVEGELIHAPRAYWGTQTWADPCGIENKWAQAVRAIDSLTLEGQSTSPEQAHFGFGYFHQSSTSQVLVDCAASNHTAIMNALNPIGPFGGTPTALGLQTAAASSCVADAGVDTVTQTDIVPQDSTNNGYEQTFKFSGLTPGQSGATISVDFWGDFGAECEFAHVVIDGIIVGNVTGNRDCNGEDSPYRAVFDVPPAAIADGEIEVVFDTRGSSDTSLDPYCETWSASVDAYCAENGATVKLRTPGTDGQGSATVLINDGAPTQSLGGREARHAAVYEACQHRRVANAYVVGLGSGTDEDFNNILAAAGGTGTCEVNGSEVDPCDDPADWESLRGDCTGSFQADNGDAMLAALAAIRDEIACTYPVDFTNSNRNDVPEDATNTYDYLTVEVRRSDTGTVEQVYNVNSPYNPNPGLGWVFASSRRQQIRLSPGYCNLVNSGKVRVVDTQLACLCEEVEGTPCSVPGAELAGVCPEGVWRCSEGIDYCEPDTNCCEPNQPCDTGLEGVCQDGVTACDGNRQYCVPTNEPSAEICDGLDNDCDGVVDEIENQPCTVPELTGRCAAGLLQCSDGNEVCLQVRYPMPELCNGLDDDCDGQTDNIRKSWEKEEFASFPLSPDVEPLTCDLRDICVCPNGTDDHAGQTFSEYVSNWDPVCSCGNSLEWSEPTGPDEPASAPGEPRAGCSSASPQSPVWLALLIGFVALSRRRR